MAVNVSVLINGEIIPMSITTTVVRPDEPVPYEPSIIARTGWRYVCYALDDELQTDYSIESDDENEGNPMLIDWVDPDDGPTEHGIHATHLADAIRAIYADMSWHE